MSYKQKKIQKIIERKQDSMDKMKSNKCVKDQKQKTIIKPIVNKQTVTPNTHKKPDKYDNKINTNLYDAYMTNKTVNNKNETAKNTNDDFFI